MSTKTSKQNVVRPDPQIPDFNSDAEEGDWLAANQDLLAGMFTKAAGEGRLTHGTTAARTKLPTTTIRLDPNDIALAREQAEVRGLKYQTYLKMIIHQALRKEARLASRRGVLTGS